MDSPRKSDYDSNRNSSVNSHDRRNNHHYTLHENSVSFDQLHGGTGMERVGFQPKYSFHQASGRHQYQYDPMEGSRRDGYQDRGYEGRYNEGIVENANIKERSHFAGSYEDDAFISKLKERDQRGQSHTSPRHVEKDALRAYNKERDQRGRISSHQNRDHIQEIDDFDHTSSGNYAEPDGYRSSSRPLSANFQSGYGKTNNEIQYNEIDIDIHHHQGLSKKSHTNQAYNFDEDQENHGIKYQDNGQVSSLRARRGRSLSKRRRNFHRISAFVDGSEEVNLGAVSGAKTLIFRRNRNIVRPQLGAESSYSDLERKSGDEFDTYLPADNEGLPSEKYRKTRTLKYRMAMLKKSHQPPTTRDMADLLRDQLVREKSYEFQTLAQLGYSRAKAWRNFKSHVRNLVYQLEVWAGSFKVIEGHFGSSTVSYFRFLRFLMFLNLYLTLIIFGVIVIPHFILPDIFIDSKQYIETYNCSVSYKQHTDELKRNSSSAGNIALSILQGTGLLENTVLFYGNYYNMSLSVPIGGVETYNMSLAYLMATGATFVLSFLLLVKNSAKGVKQGILETSGGSLTHQFFNKVFGGWDFCVSSESTASIKHKSLKLELETDLEYQRLYWRKQNRTAKEKLKLVVIRLLINLLCFGILGASLYLIFYVNEKLIALQNEAKKVTEILVLLVQYLPSVTITLLSTIVPIIFTKLILAEEYTPQFQIRLTLFRIVLLRLASLGVLMLSLFTTIKNNEGYRCGNQNLTHDSSNSSVCENCTENNINFTTVDFKSFNEINQLECWETYLGQQIYKLVIMNFIVVIAVTFLWEFPRK
ncbi:hypothetical protein CHS0354_043139 [Potamilus streckersoni]|uniref:TMC domain-containing protein n=1 Tax=Potamilus streckersoni TaxID=2493646 RepID=A0AAE0SCG3_9BIVA|nr:hypothetical protein CHS0354_043139 [Potamilus streckersoni]